MNKSVVIFALFLPLLGCGVDAPRPKLEAPLATPSPPLSTLSARLEISAREIERLVNEKTSGTIADLEDQEIKCPLGGRCRLDLTLARTGPAELSAQEGLLGVKLPFRLHAVLKPSGFLAFAKGEGDAQGMASATTSLALDEGWRLQSHLEGHVELGNAHLRLGPLVTNVTELWNGDQQSLARPLWRMLDGEIAHVQLKPQIEAFWNEAFTPIVVGKSPRAWLVLRPENIWVMQPRMTNGMLTLALKLSARGEVTVQQVAPANPAAALPAPLPLDQASDSFSVSVPFFLSYAEAERLAQDSLRRHPPAMQGARLEVSLIRILPSRNEVGVETRFCADANWDIGGLFRSCAHVYLIGRPEFDAGTLTLRIAGLHYDMASAGLMLHLFQHIVRPDQVAGLIERHLVFDERSDILRLEENVRQKLAKPHGKTLSISAEVRAFGAPSFMWMKDGFLAFFPATGTVKPIFRT